MPNILRNRQLTYKMYQINPNKCFAGPLNRTDALAPLPKHCDRAEGGSDFSNSCGPVHIFCREYYDHFFVIRVKVYSH